ncbi:AP-3 complex subunit beta-2-like isoform X2 [Artemia franciscana]|uniref:AP-3 complex subunit beta-2-like isoform X2 n=1 Tax=Artemia franciscana TaxID=6661 RepID=UPI0032DB146A
MANQGVMTSLRDENHSTPDTEFASEATIGNFFSTDYKRNDDLKQMLDSNKDGLKLEAMKRIITMIAKGRDPSHLFPAVVKNVVSKNIEVKKLVYVYLVRYAEEQQDLALLSISTFQRALKDPNQLIRASALRVLSSIRVPVIAPIVMLAIKESAADMSPYVRKTAAHSIPKLYSLDPEQKDELVAVIEKLLMDKATLVIGSAVMAFEQVCPERTDLIHKNYRKLCNLIVDVEEWGQVLILNMLTRYARTQFVDPNTKQPVPEKEFYEEEEEDEATDEPTRPRSLDADHRLLLRNAKPLLQSRNSAVVMAVAQLYYHLAPKNEVGTVARPLLRLVRSQREIQSVVLTTIASMSVKRKDMFEPHFKSFFIHTVDPLPVKLMKLDILTNLAGESNISLLLREFQVYIASQDSKFVAATIQAIGRCASNIKEVTSTCLAGLVALLSNKDEAIVAESVVVIKNLLQSQSADQEAIITKMIKLIDHVIVPVARASILWLIGEYCDKVAKYGPDVLRQMAKSFTNEEDLVKLQIVNLAAKLFVTNPKQTTLLCQYVLNLAKYDISYDIRDRARLIRNILFPSENIKAIKNPKKIFLAPKPAPILESKYKDRDTFQLGSLSHFLNIRANGYRDLPDFPEVAPDSTVRNVEPPSRPTSVNAERVSVSYAQEEKSKRKPTFYSSSSEEEEVDGEESKSETSETVTESDSEMSELQSEPDQDLDKKSISIQEKTAGKTADSTEDSDSSESETSSESEEDEIRPKAAQGTTSPPSAQTTKSNLDLLLDFDGVPDIPTPIITPTIGGFLTPIVPTVTTSSSLMSNSVDSIVMSSPAYVANNPKELISRTAGNGIQVGIRFTRSPHLYSSTMASIELHFTNTTAEDLGEIKVANKVLPVGMTICDFPVVSSLPHGQTRTALIGIDFGDSTQAAVFDISIGDRILKLSIKPPIGEIIRAVSMSETYFLSQQVKLRGMQESTAVATLPPSVVDGHAICRRVYEVANVSPIPSSDPLVFRFGGQTLSSKTLVLITLKTEAPKVTVIVNCEKIIIGQMLANQVKEALDKH